MSANSSNEIKQPIEKPSSSRIESFVSDDELGFIFPPLGLRGIVWFLLLFAVIWNVSILAALFQALRLSDMEGVFFLIPFIGVGLVTVVVFVYVTKTEVALLVSRETVTLSRTIFGKSFTQVRNYQALRGIERVICYRKNQKPVYGIGLEFLGSRDFKFGSNLKENEKRWILSTLQLFHSKT
ncbi:MAG TPA: hypothetical protein DCX06_13675 [Opitutae bacterium]|nr:hypothetical protein [Opitutae bacterium]